VCLTAGIRLAGKEGKVTVVVTVTDSTRYTDPWRQAQTELAWLAWFKTKTTYA